jgi:hypothetical protein
VVYAQEADGTVSPRSREVVGTRGVSNLSGTATPHNVMLSWDAFDVPVGETVGYNVYRSTTDGSFGEPLDFTSVIDSDGGTAYTDTGLEPDRTYYYKVEARNGQGQLFGRSETVEVTTASDTDEYMTYANIKTAIVIYRDVENGTTNISPKMVENIKKALGYVREFYWRNSELQLNQEYTYFVIDEQVSFDNQGSYSSARETAQDLADKFGVANAQYDMIFRILPYDLSNAPAYWSIGTIQVASDLLDFKDRNRQTGFSQVKWPLGGDKYPHNSGDRRLPRALIWTAEHEMQHVIDAIYSDNDEPQMGHGDNPKSYAVDSLGYNFPDSFSDRFARWFSYQSTMFRDFESYKDFNPAWGDVYETLDRDDDGFPDRDSLVRFDEERFGSSSTQADTDGDGYTDKREAVNGYYDGLYHYSHTDPRDTDSDDDGMIDGKDEYPRYPGDFTVKREAFDPTLDGNLSEWPDSTVVSDSVSYVFNGVPFAPTVHMSYNRDTLFMALDAPISGPRLGFDFGANGLRQGSGDARITIEATEERIGNTSAISNLEAEIENRNDNRVLVEMAVPGANANGLTLQPDEQFGFFANYRNADLSGGPAHTFDRYSYVYVTLGGDTTDTDAEPLPEQRAESLALQPNYPNPFRRRTTIEYALDQPGRVRLAVYDLMGRRVRTLVRRDQTAGAYTATWDGRGPSGQRVASGVYVYRLTAPGGRQVTRKMTVVR